MAVFAAVSCGFAWYYAPKNEIAVVNSRIGELLLEPAESPGLTLAPDESEQPAYEARDVARIAIQRYDRQIDSMRMLEVAREQGSWVFPEKAGYPVTDAQQISGIIDSFRQARILDMPSDQIDDHEKYGVVDPDASGGDTVGFGTIVSLEDNRRNELAKVIVGNPVEDDEGKHYVRLPGQPQIYVIDFDSGLLSTTFSDWVEGDLLRLQGSLQQLDNVLDSIEVESYFVDQQSGAGVDEARNWVYRARFYPDTQGWKYDLWKANADRQLPEVPTVSGANATPAVLGGIVRELADFSRDPNTQAGDTGPAPLRDVVRKSTEASIALSEPEAGTPESRLGWLSAKGFQPAGFDNNQHQFRSMSGRVRLKFRNGLVETVYVGALAGLDIQERTNINRYLLVTAGVDESLVPEPVDPNGGSGGEGDTPTEGDDTAAGNEQDGAENTESSQIQDDDDVRREYLQKVNERNALLNNARTLSGNLNQIHGNWLYVVTQNCVDRIIPPLEAFQQ